MAIAATRRSKDGFVCPLAITEEKAQHAGLVVAVPRACNLGPTKFEVRLGNYVAEEGKCLIIASASAAARCGARGLQLAFEFYRSKVWLPSGLSFQPRPLHAVSAFGGSQGLEQMRGSTSSKTMIGFVCFSR